MDMARSGWSWGGIRPIAYWVTTLVVVFELVSGSVWNLLAIEWIDVQLRHLGYPDFFAYILGVWHVGAAVAIIAPRVPLIKEWAYVGTFFLWSGAVASHLTLGDPVQTWGVPLAFGACAIASWLLRPADRRLPQTRLRRGGPADETPQVRRAWETRPRAWAIPGGLLVVMYAVSFLTLPLVEVSMLEFAVDLGWI